MTRPPWSEVAQRLGLPTDTDETTVLAALDEVLAEQADPSSPNTAGVVVLDQAVHAELAAAAEHGRTARAREQRATRDALVDAAVMDGRITAGRAGAWRASLERDPGGAQVLAELPAGLAVPTTERGHDQVAQLNDTGWFPGAAGATAGGPAS